MKSFMDSAGRTWTLALSIDAAKRVKALLGVDLLKPADGDPPLLTRLGSDVMLVCDVIFAIVKPQADALGVSDEQFGAALGGDAILAAQGAFAEELVDFFRQLRRTDLARMTAMQQAVIVKAVAAAERRIDALDVDAMIESTFGNASTASPASSESTPAP